MPCIRVKLIDEVFAAEQKMEGIAELTRAIVSLQGKQPITLLIIEEESSDESDGFTNASEHPAAYVSSSSPA